MPLSFPNTATEHIGTPVPPTSVHTESPPSTSPGAGQRARASGGHADNLPRSVRNTVAGKHTDAKAMVPKAVHVKGGAVSSLGQAVSATRRGPANPRQPTLRQPQPPLPSNRSTRDALASRQPAPVLTTRSMPLHPLGKNARAPEGQLRVRIEYFGRSLLAAATPLTWRTDPVTGKKQATTVSVAFAGCGAIEMKRSRTATAAGIVYRPLHHAGLPGGAPPVVIPDDDDATAGTPPPQEDLVVVKMEGFEPQDVTASVTATQHAVAARLHPVLAARLPDAGDQLLAHLMLGWHLDEQALQGAHVVRATDHNGNAALQLLVDGRNIALQAGLPETLLEALAAPPGTAPRFAGETDFTARLERIVQHLRSVLPDARLDCLLAGDAAAPRQKLMHACLNTLVRMFPGPDARDCEALGWMTASDIQLDVANNTLHWCDTQMNVDRHGDMSETETAQFASLLLLRHREGGNAAPLWTDRNGEPLDSFEVTALVLRSQPGEDRRARILEAAIPDSMPFHERSRLIAHMALNGLIDFEQPLSWPQRVTECYVGSVREGADELLQEHDLVGAYLHDRWESAGDPLQQQSRSPIYVPPGQDLTEAMIDTCCQQTLRSALPALRTAAGLPHQDGDRFILSTELRVAGLQAAAGDRVLRLRTVATELGALYLTALAPAQALAQIAHACAGAFGVTDTAAQALVDAALASLQDLANPDCRLDHRTMVCHLTHDGVRHDIAVSFDERGELLRLALRTAGVPAGPGANAFSDLASFGQPALCMLWQRQPRAGITHDLHGMRPAFIGQYAIFRFDDDAREGSTTLFASQRMFNDIARNAGMDGVALAHAALGHIDETRCTWLPATGGSTRHAFTHRGGACEAAIGYDADGAVTSLDISRHSTADNGAAHERLVLSWRMPSYTELVQTLPREVRTLFKVATVTGIEATLADGRMLQQTVFADETMVDALVAMHGAQAGELLNAAMKHLQAQSCRREQAGALTAAHYAFTHRDRRYLATLSFNEDGRIRKLDIGAAGGAAIGWDGARATPNVGAVVHKMLETYGATGDDLSDPIRTLVYNAIGDGIADLYRQPGERPADAAAIARRLAQQPAIHAAIAAPILAQCLLRRQANVTFALTDGQAQRLCTLVRNHGAALCGNAAAVANALAATTPVTTALATALARAAMLEDQVMHALLRRHNVAASTLDSAGHAALWAQVSAKAGERYDAQAGATLAEIHHVPQRIADTLAGDPALNRLLSGLLPSRREAGNAGATPSGPEPAQYTPAIEPLFGGELAMDFTLHGASTPATVAVTDDNAPKEVGIDRTRDEFQATGRMDAPPVANDLEAKSDALFDEVWDGVEQIIGIDELSPGNRSRIEAHIATLVGQAIAAAEAHTDEDTADLTAAILLDPVLQQILAPAMTNPSPQDSVTLDTALQGLGIPRDQLSDTQYQQFLQQLQRTPTPAQAAALRRNEGQSNADDAAVTRIFRNARLAEALRQYTVQRDIGQYHAQAAILATQLAVRTDAHPPVPAHYAQFTVEGPGPRDEHGNTWYRPKQQPNEHNCSVHSVNAMFGCPVLSDAQARNWSLEWAAKSKGGPLSAQETQQALADFSQVGVEAVALHWMLKEKLGLPVMLYHCSPEDAEDGTLALDIKQTRFLDGLGRMALHTVAQNGASHWCAMRGQTCLDSRAAQRQRDIDVTGLLRQQGAVNFTAIILEPDVRIALAKQPTTDAMEDVRPTGIANAPTSGAETTVTPTVRKPRHDTPTPTNGNTGAPSAKKRQRIAPPSPSQGGSDIDPPLPRFDDSGTIDELAWLALDDDGHPVYVTGNDSVSATASPARNTRALAAPAGSPPQSQAIPAFTHAGTEVARTGFTRSRTRSGEDWLELGYATISSRLNKRLLTPPKTPGESLITYLGTKGVALSSLKLEQASQPHIVTGRDYADWMRPMLELLYLRAQSPLSESDLAQLDATGMAQALDAIARSNEDNVRCLFLDLNEFILIPGELGAETLGLVTKAHGKGKTFTSYLNAFLSIVQEHTASPEDTTWQFGMSYTGGLKKLGGNFVTRYPLHQFAQDAYAKTMPELSIGWERCKSDSTKLLAKLDNSCSFASPSPLESIDDISPGMMKALGLSDRAIGPLVGKSGFARWWRNNAAATRTQYRLRPQDDGSEAPAPSLLPLDRFQPYSCAPHHWPLQQPNIDAWKQYNQDLRMDAFRRQPGKQLSRATSNNKLAGFGDFLRFIEQNTLKPTWIAGISDKDLERTLWALEIPITSADVREQRRDLTLHTLTPALVDECAEYELDFLMKVCGGPSQLSSQAQRTWLKNAANQAGLRFDLSMFKNMPQTAQNVIGLAMLNTTSNSHTVPAIFEATGARIIRSNLPSSWQPRLTAHRVLEATCLGITRDANVPGALRRLIYAFEQHWKGGEPTLMDTFNEEISDHTAPVKKTARALDLGLSDIDRLHALHEVYQEHIATGATISIDDAPAIAENNELLDRYLSSLPADVAARQRPVLVTWMHRIESTVDGPSDNLVLDELVLPYTAFHEHNSLTFADDPDRDAPGIVLAFKRTLFPDPAPAVQPGPSTTTTP